jgi:malonyl-CoA O-methyltransferase
MNTFTHDKGIIKISFSKAASTYDAYSALQKTTAKYLLELKNKIGFSPANRECHFALDIGCGTGTLTLSFKNKYPEINLFGCDFSLPMISKAKEKIHDGSVRLLISDCDELPFKDALFDTVISNLTYQWVPDILSSFKEISRILKPGGLFIFSTLGPRTLEELRTSIIKSEDVNGINGRIDFMRFHEENSLSRNLQKAGLETLAMENVLDKKNYKNLWDLLRTLKYTGASPPFSNGEKSLGRGLFLKRIEKYYLKHFPNSSRTGILATYSIVNIAAKKSILKNDYSK